MAVTLGPCVKGILCSLGASILNGINAVISIYVTAVQVTIAAITAQLALLEIQLIPITAAKAIAEAAFAQIEAAIQLLPLSLIEGCVDLGKLNLFAAEAFKDIRADVNNFLDDLSRLLSLKEELEAIKAELNAIVSFFGSIQIVLQDCAAAQAGG